MINMLGLQYKEVHTDVEPRKGFGLRRVCTQYER